MRLENVILRAHSSQKLSGIPTGSNNPGIDVGAEEPGEKLNMDRARRSHPIDGSLHCR